MANVISITALNRYVKTLLESDAVLSDIALRGEISNFVNHYKTGHFYFTLKDEKCNVKAVMFRSDAQRMAFMPQNGMRVIVRCRISLFERDGAFQIYAEEMFLDGVGALQEAFDRLKMQLDAEGLFDSEHKKMLPALPKKVGLITSKTGAALQDVLSVTQRRYPMAHLLLAPVTVQGIDAASGIVQAIEALDCTNVDVIIVTRGGGSQEDLWLFNDERIARAAYACKTPLVSAIGHEIDFTILDFVADLRAPTPSAAAELVMPNVVENYYDLCKTYTNICKEIHSYYDLCYNKYIELQNAPALIAVKQMPAQKAQALQQTAAALQQAMARCMNTKETSLARQAALAASLNPFAVLARGYSVASLQSGALLTRAQQVSYGDEISLKLQEGTVRCTVLTAESE